MFHELKQKHEALVSAAESEKNSRVATAKAAIAKAENDAAAATANATTAFERAVATAKQEHVTRILAELTDLCERWLDDDSRDSAAAIANAWGRLSMLAERDTGELPGRHLLLVALASAKYDSAEFGKLGCTELYHCVGDAPMLHLEAFASAVDSLAARSALTRAEAALASQWSRLAADSRRAAVIRSSLSHSDKQVGLENCRVDAERQARDEHADRVAKAEAEGFRMPSSDGRGFAADGSTNRSFIARLTGG